MRFNQLFQLIINPIYLKNKLTPQHKKRTIKTYSSVNSKIQCLFDD